MPPLPVAVQGRLRPSGADSDRRNADRSPQADLPFLIWSGRYGWGKTLLRVADDTGGAKAINRQKRVHWVLLSEGCRDPHASAAI
jgi:hypothetical protein